MHLKCSEIVWMQKWKERLSRFRRRFFLTEHDLIEFIQQFEKFKDDHRALINGYVMQTPTMSEYNQKMERIDDSMRLLWKLGNKNKSDLRIMKGVNTKQKKSIDQLRDINSEFEMYIKEWDKERSDIEGILGEQEKVQKTLSKNHKDIFFILNEVTKKMDILKDAYDAAYYFQESVNNLTKAHERAFKEIDLAIRKSMDERQKLDIIADQYRSAVDAQAKGHIASMQGILRELERKNK